MASSVYIKINISKVVKDKAKVLNEALGKVAETIKADCNVYCRHDKGTLKKSARVEAGTEDIGRNVTWNTPYAKKVYYTGEPSKDQNPKASLMWCEKAKATYSKDWGKRIEESL